MPRVAAQQGPSIGTFPSFAETFRASDCNFDCMAKRDAISGHRSRSCVSDGASHP